MSPVEVVAVGSLILPDRIAHDWALSTRGGRIERVGPASEILPSLGIDFERWIRSRRESAETSKTSQGASPEAVGAGSPLLLVAPPGGFISPGFVDLHVHGGSGGDFMDGAAGPFETALRAHYRHGTTSIVPTTTAARHERILQTLALCREFKNYPRVGAPRVLGAHLYGPYFQPAARGCHPGEPIRDPVAVEYRQYLEFADAIVSASVAPEIEGAEGFTRACQARGVWVGSGHSHATFSRMAEAVGWGVKHVDHLYCAMSDKSKLRQFRAYPMQGGVLEATLYFDELTTEVIADGRHLTADLLLLALKIKGAERLALVTDCNRALDMPEGRYIFGPIDDGVPFDHVDGVGLMPDRLSLASSAQGMDEMVRVFHRMTGRPLWETVRMASLTPATIAGFENEIGSLEVGKWADLLVLSEKLEVERVVGAGQAG